MRRAQVIGAVFAQMAESGLEGLTLDRVAARARVSKGVVTYYFKSKRRLLLESFRAILESYNQEIMSRIKPGMSASELLLAIIQETLAPGGAHGSPGSGPSPDDYSKVLIHFYQKSVLYQEFRQTLLEMYGLFQDSTREVIRQGIEQGEFRRVDPEEAAYGLLALLDGILLHRAIGFRPLSLKRAETICRRQVENLRA